MEHRPFSYFSATAHPWPCLIFLIPLLLIYEGGVIYLGGTDINNLQNGADVWLRLALEVFGLKEYLAAPLAIIFIFVLWCLYRWQDRPGRYLTVCSGMALESVFFALGLWIISRNFYTILRSAGIPLSTPQAAIPVDALAQIVNYVGAGIYEEVIFRLLLFVGMGAILRFCGIPGLIAVLMSAITSSLIFAGAHHWGPGGEEFDRFRFLFRTAAGLYFAFLFWLRGFGIAVGAHAGYDVLVGVEFR